MRSGVVSAQNTAGAQRVVVQATTLPPRLICVSSQGPACLPPHPPAPSSRGTEVDGLGEPNPSAFPLVMWVMRVPSSLGSLGVSRPLSPMLLLRLGTPVVWWRSAWTQGDKPGFES